MKEERVCGHHPTRARATSSVSSYSTRLRHASLFYLATALIQRRINRPIRSLYPHFQSWVFIRPNLQWRSRVQAVIFRLRQPTLYLCLSVLLSVRPLVTTSFDKIKRDNLTKKNPKNLDIYLIFCPLRGNRLK